MTASRPPVGDDRVSWKVLLPAFAVLAMIGAALGLLSQDWRQALTLVSKVLIVLAAALGLLALVQLLRQRRGAATISRARRRAAVADDAVADDAVADPADTGDAVADLAGTGDAVAKEAVAGGSIDETVPAAPVAPEIASPAAASGVAEPVLAPAGTGAADVVMQAAGHQPRPEVLDAIAPYAEVVGQPVIVHEAPVARAARVASPPPPPPPARPAGFVPPPPPAAAPAPATAPPAAAAPAVAPPVPVVAPPVVSAPPSLAPAATAPPAANPAPAPAAGDPAPAPVTTPSPAQPVAAPVPPPVVSETPPQPVAHRNGAVSPAEPLAAVSDLVPSADVPGWSRSSAFPAARGATVPFTPDSAVADVATRSAVGSVAPVIVYRYRKWVLGQMVPGAPFEPVDVDRTPDEWLLLSTCGVATLMAWTHEDHHFTYPVETWADEILPAHGVRIRDRQLAVDLLLAAALHAGGIDAVPSDRLRSYQPGDLVTAMASIHVGLLRLYCGLGRIGPERVLADQYGIGPGDIPLH